MTKQPSLAELGDMLAHIVQHMAVKDDIAELRTELKDEVAFVKTELEDARIELRGKLDGINRRLDTEAMLRTGDNIPGRLAAVEKHLGIVRTILG